MACGKTSKRVLLIAGLHAHHPLAMHSPFVIFPAFSQPRRAPRARPLRPMLLTRTFCPPATDEFYGLRVDRQVRRPPQHKPADPRLAPRRRQRQVRGEGQPTPRRVVSLFVSHWHFPLFCLISYLRRTYKLLLQNILKDRKSYISLANYYTKKSLRAIAIIFLLGFPPSQRFPS